MPVKDAKKIGIYASQCFCINLKSVKHILDIKVTSVFKCPSDSRNLNPSYTRGLKYHEGEL